MRENASAGHIAAAVEQVSTLNSGAIGRYGKKTLGVVILTFSFVRNTAKQSLLCSAIC
jgi:hypothetical protein